MTPIKKISFLIFISLLPAGFRGQEIDTVSYAADRTGEIAIAYGKTTKEAAASALSAVYAIDLQKNAVTTLEESLNGTLSGLYSAKNGGQKFGARNYNFFIRGKATTADASPLILVDDVEANIELLDFNEVESVNILKDASALAIYGMRGANGVILIKTKRGYNAPNTVKLDIRMGIQTPLSWGKRLNAYDYSTLYNEALTNDGGVGIYTPDAYLNNSNPYAYPDVDFGDLFLKQQSLSQQYNFTVQGGTQTARYFFLTGYTKQGGLFALPDKHDGINQKSYERYNFRSNIDVNLGAGFNMSVDVSAIFDYNRSPWMNSSGNANALSNALVNLIVNTPANAFPVWNGDGSLGGTSVYLNNPQGILQRGGTRRDEHKLLASNAKISKDLPFITQGLKVYAVYHFENYNSSYKSAYKQFAVYHYNPAADTYTAYGTNDTKTTTAGGQTSEYYRNNNIFAGLEYERTFNRHQVEGLAFFNRSQSSVSGDVPDYHYQGWAARAQYGYDHRYYAELSAACQGSNRYRHGKRYGFFPAIGLSWVLSNENFLQNSPAVDFLKLRVSTGINGNDKTLGNRFAWRQSWYTGSGYGFGNPNAVGDGSYEGALANENATWEKAAKANVGIDFSTLGGDLSATVDLFSERRKHIPVEESSQTPSLIGIALPQVNEGIITNKGVEAALNYSKTTGFWRFSIGGNFLFARNKIVDLKEPDYSYDWMYRKGNSINTIYGLVADGIYRTPEEIAHASKSSYTTLTPGDIRYVNQNPGDDDIINQADRVPIGNAFPEIFYGLQLGVSYRNFDFAGFGKGVARSDVYFKPEQFSVYARDNRWQPSQPEGQHPKLSISNVHNSQTSSFWLQSGSYFQISSLELGYTLPQSILKSLSIAGVRVYCNVNNVFTFSSEREKRNPEALLAGYTEYPLLRTYLFGISVKL
ncbi:MAG: SusC/RagA family TonB-linked outer membrane protein [Dysgonamonadaceae bacterium]|jgi:TonB-linked SusC/RagA family outer membrane protein|nr:SusC/RagA family TonB-linked outer membrane protein [Dysgonamonadaceae bacterium]